MSGYTTINNLGLLRLVSRVLPLKHKLSFLVKKYLADGSDLAIRYYRDWYVCTTVSDLNRSTVEQVIMEGVFSQPEVALIKEIRNRLPEEMVMVDVGGNIGTFLCQFIDKCSKVYVFEPIPRLNDVIKRSVEYNKDKKVVLIAKAIGDQPGSVKMLDNNNSSIVTAGAGTAVLDIPVTTLDMECSDLQKIDFIKIDVEGYEVNVLNGASATIDKHRPFILVEVHPGFLKEYGRDHNEVIRFFEKRNYKISYYSFLEELRMPKWQRVVSRWKGNKGVKFSTKEDFLKDTAKTPLISSYHFFCEPK